MRVIGRLLVCCLLFACALSANATKINILDPPGFTTYPITGSPFIVTFTSCGANELPDPNLSADGCFAGVNRTGMNWSALELVVPDTGPLVAQGTPLCNTTGTTYQIFADASCTYDGTSNSFDLVFNGGAITNSQLFIITEDGVVPPEDFPPMTAYITFADAGTTPEPPAMLLVSTGLLCIGFCVWSRRRSSV